MLDACFTHKSFLFENKSANGDSYDNLSTLGSKVIEFCICLELMKCFDVVCQGQVGRLAVYRNGLLSIKNLYKVFKTDWLPKLKRGNGVSVLESKEAKANIVQAIFGAIFLNAFQNKVVDPLETVLKVVNKLIPIHREVESDNDLTDYSSWLNSFISPLGLELFQAKILEEGLAHKKRFLVELRVFHPLNNDLDFSSEGTGVTKKEATRQACKELFKQLKMFFNLSDYSIYSNSENWQNVLSKLISLAIKPSTHQQENLSLIGGLCLKSWSDEAATNILNNLYDNMLFTEIRIVYKLWTENNLSKKADAIISSHTNSYELIELILFEEVQENCSMDEAKIKKEMKFEQKLEKSQNRKEVDKPPTNDTKLSLNNELESSKVVTGIEVGLKKEKPIEKGKLNGETKIKSEDTQNTEKVKDLKTSADSTNEQIVINHSEGEQGQFYGIKDIPKNHISKINKEEQVSNIKAVISNSNKTNEKNSIQKILSSPISKSSKSVKLYKVHSRIFRFSSDRCPFCNEELKDYNRVILVNQKTEAKYIASSIKCCLVCDICGLIDMGLSSLGERGFLPLFYQGSPTYFQSTVITKALNPESIIRVISQEQVLVATDLIVEDEPIDQEDIESSPTKRQRVITPEALAKSLEFKNRIGMAGEKFVLEWERGYLEKIGRIDLAKRIVWEAQKNCAAGYDILSYFADGSPKYIEVKSTSGNSMSFEVTANEWEWAKYYGENYCIYRVFNVFGTTNMEKLENPISLYEQNKLQLTPTSFKATFL
ncbi:Ribonuclease 3 [bioreactor metagenome]|uniref:Ribonuclease 3 n=1 Tax=bioreactor metagenome TaxID=1076179 RepID=A0A644XIH5_9ZZZZ|nr:DUF3883 domain-containing protein [Desulfitobacterium hafniense]MEA5024604.1 DUF3883 domain-containing protein [Desulfitobacterium hafniense]